MRTNQYYMAIRYSFARIFRLQFCEYIEKSGTSEKESEAHLSSSQVLGDRFKPMCIHMQCWKAAEKSPNRTTADENLLNICDGVSHNAPAATGRGSKSVTGH